MRGLSWLVEACMPLLESVRHAQCLIPAVLTHLDGISSSVETGIMGRLKNTLKMNSLVDEIPVSCLSSVFVTGRI